MMLIAWAGTIAGPIVAWLLWRRRTPLARAALAVLVVAYGLGVWTFLIEPELLVVRRFAVYTTAWTGPPVRIAILSDTHVGGPHVSARRVERVAARLSRENADAIVFVGDYVGGHTAAVERTPEARAEIERGIAALGRAKAPARAAVLGNHDWWYDGAAVAVALRRAGLPVLENGAIRVQGRTGRSFWIAGVADFHTERDPPSVPAALAPVTTDEPVILLTHWPDVFPKVPPRVALTIAGHSHCGQVNFPIVGRPLTPSPGSARWPCGLYDVGGRKLVVSGGLGTSILPVRFRAPPEIVVVSVRGPS